MLCLSNEQKRQRIADRFNRNFLSFVASVLFPCRIEIEWKQRKTSFVSLVPSLKSAALNEFQQKIFRNDSTNFTLDKFLTVTKNALIEITGHPVRRRSSKLFSWNLFVFSRSPISVRTITIYVLCWFSRAVIRSTSTVFLRIWKLCIRFVFFAVFVKKTKRSFRFLRSTKNAPKRRTIRFCLRTRISGVHFVVNRRTLWFRCSTRKIIFLNKKFRWLSTVSNDFTNRWFDRRDPNS